MAIPNCVKCGNTIFSFQNHPVGRDRKIDVLYCSRCGAVAGITGSREGQDRIDQVLTFLKKIAAKLGA